MFHSPHDSKAILISKHLIFWIALGSMFGLFIFLFTSDFSIPQREVKIEINVKDQINICEPEEENSDQKSFFNLSSFR